jgi:uncharacterized SAM-binding protein YcdF (DUF218 family)
VFLYLSKFLPQFLYPLGFATILLIAALLLWRRARRVSLVLTVVALLAIWLGGNRLVSMALIRPLEWQYPSLAQTPHADAIVVLGGGSRPASPPRPSAEVSDGGDRLIYAVELYKAGAAPHLLLSGGIVGVDGPALAPEAESMAELLTTMGVPPDALWLESKSRNTYENAVETKQILDGKGIQRIILVTSAMHMPRSVAIFKNQGFDVIPAPTDYSVTVADWDYYFTPDLSIQALNLFPTPEAMDRTQRALKEYIGLLVYRVRGWL